MTKTKKICIGLGIILVGALYLYIYSDWFKSSQVQIFHRVTMARVRRQKFRQPVVESQPMVAFGFDRKLKLTEITVVSVAALATNKNALPVWHLVSASNSVPLKGIFYGERIWGMAPAVKGTYARPLETNETYRLLVKASGMAGQHDFSLGKVVTNSAAN